jgi:hypothetical protein
MRPDMIPSCGFDELSGDRKKLTKIKVNDSPGLRGRVLNGLGLAAPDLVLGRLSTAIEILADELGKLCWEVEGVAVEVMYLMKPAALVS